MKDDDILDDEPQGEEPQDDASLTDSEATLEDSEEELEENTETLESKSFDDIDVDDFDPELFDIEDDFDLFAEIPGIYQIWTNWAFFSLSFDDPSIQEYENVAIIEAEYIEAAGRHEHVYPIFDYGNRLAISKAENMLSVGASMCKMYYTIEKLIVIMMQRFKDSGIEDMQQERKVSFEGHQLAQRKAFESIINLSENVVVSNFDPGDWGDKYLQIIKVIADKGYGYPSESPRDNYRNYPGANPNPKKSSV